MNGRALGRAGAWALAWCALSSSWTAVVAAQAKLPLRLARYTNASQVDVVLDERATPVHVAEGQRVGSWTFVSGVASDPPCAVFEDFEHLDGRILFVDVRGVRLDLGKTSEETWAKPESLYLGHTPEQILASPDDLLGAQILDRPGAADPDYAEIASVFPPLKRLRGDVHAFLGAPETAEKVAFGYGGRSPSFDPASVSPSVDAVRKAGHVRHGLVGGWLPVLRYVYPDTPTSYTELLAFAPRRVLNGNSRHQPVWVRVARVERGALRATHYVDSYLATPPRTPPQPAAFYADLLQLKAAWDGTLEEAMQVDVPDARVSNLARHSLVNAIMTRVEDYPKYGVFDRDYAGAEHDGFPDTFTVETTAMLQWGLLGRARSYIDNYFARFVRDDGSVLYRGPEIGQFARMLSVLAEYVEHGGWPDVLLAQRAHIDALTRALLGMRQTALQLPAASPAHGMLAGFCEADSCLEQEPARYVQPYFSNSLLAARGFTDLGRVWAKLGREREDAELRAWGECLQREGSELARDVAQALERSWLQVDGTRALPVIAGARELPELAVQRDPVDPQFRAYRAYNEMMQSGLLTLDQLHGIVDYRTHHHQVLLGIPTAYSKPELAGFLAYGYAYGLIQADMIRQALLLFYGLVAHQYTRGAWVAPETRLLFDQWEAAPYCTPAQLAAPLILRWLLVFEDPQSDTLWLGRGMPRAWLGDGKVVRVARAPTRWGQVSFQIASHVKSGVIRAELQLPAAPVKLRLRTPTHAPIKSVRVNGKAWSDFDPSAESISLPAARGDRLSLEVRY